MQVVIALLLVVLSFITPAPAAACSCRGGDGKFATAAKRAVVVALGRVSKHAVPGTEGIRFLAADIEVLRQYKGEPKRTIRVWGGHGTDCQVPADALPDGSTWFLALHALGADAKWYKGAEETDFYLAMCSKSLERVPEEAEARKALVGKVERSLNAR